MIRTWLLVFLACSVQAGCADAPTRATPPTSASAPTSAGKVSAGELRKSGTVKLDVTCSAAAQRDFQTPLALLHSFFYEEAARRLGRTDVARKHYEQVLVLLARSQEHPTEVAAARAFLSENKP